MTRMLPTSLIAALMIAFCSAAFAVDRHALLIGISDYSDTGFPSLDGPPNDLSLVGGVLLDRFGFGADQVTVLLNEQASHTGVKQAFASLAMRVRRADFVYIHFSGHGSCTPDLNHDEDRTGKDQTWVSHGSRRQARRIDEKAIDGRAKTAQETDLNRFDILDDEINLWLAPIFAKTDHVVFVSDSCHSGTITRSIASGGRSVPMDFRPHPAGKRKYERVWFDSGVRIGAARDHENATEFLAGDGKVYGVFTWHWVRALQQASPGETWDDIHKRTSTRISLIKGEAQHPQIEGTTGRGRLVFGGSFQKVSRTVPVRKVMGQGKRVVLGVGALLGATQGSLYCSDDPGAGDAGPLAAVEIIRVYPFESVARVISGDLRAGDLMVETSHVYRFDPFKVFVNADFAESEDRLLIERIHLALSGLDAFEPIDEQTRADIVLYVLRPRVKDGRFILRAEKDGFRHSLPESFRKAPPQVWGLTPGEMLLYEKFRIHLSDRDKGIELLLENLERIARIRALKELEPPPGAPRPVALTTTLLTPVEFCGENPECISLETGNFQIEGPLAPVQLAGRILTPGTVLTFRLRNVSESGYYCYLLDISPNGEIKVIFGDNESDALIPAGKEVDMLKEKRGLLITGGSGEETVKLIASQRPVYIGLLTQDKLRRGSIIPQTGLEMLLTRAGRGGANSERFSLEDAHWATDQVSFKVILPDITQDSKSD